MSFIGSLTVASAACTSSAHNVCVSKPYLETVYSQAAPCLCIAILQVADGAVVHILLLLT